MSLTPSSTWALPLINGRSLKRPIETIIIDDDDEDSTSKAKTTKPNPTIHSTSSSLNTTIENTIAATIHIENDDQFLLLESGRFSVNLIVSSDSSPSPNTKLDLVLEPNRFGDDSVPNICLVNASSRQVLGYLRRGIAQILSPLLSAKRIQLEAVVEQQKTDMPRCRSMAISVIVLTCSNNDCAIQEFLHHVHLVKHPIQSTTQGDDPVLVKQDPSSSSNQNIPHPPPDPSSTLRHLQHIKMLADMKNSHSAHYYSRNPTPSALTKPGHPLYIQPPPFTSQYIPPPPSSHHIPFSQSARQFIPSSQLHSSVPNNSMIGLMDVAEGDRFSALLSSSTDFDESTRSQLLDAIGMKEEELANLDEAPQPMGLVTELLPYQRQGLGWMLRSEHPVEPTSTIESQFWIVKSVPGQPSDSAEAAGSSGGDIEVFFNSATNSIARCKPRLARGCLIADDMGLGKTIQILALILSDASGQPFIKNGCGNSISYCDATLIVCPLSVVGNWESQIKQHVQPSRLRLYVYHGPTRNRNTRFLQTRDLVITTYETLANAPDDNSPLHQIKWRRVVLDEGHNIRTRKTKRSKAACSLFAERKIVLSGTPINNKLTDLYPLLKFMEFYPFDNFEVWKSTIERPCNSGRRDGMFKLKVLMRNMCLRRTKRMKLNGKPLIELPPFKSVVHKVPFSPEERTLYTQWEAKSRLTYAEILKNSQARADARHMGSADLSVQPAQSFGSILKFLLRLRQLCNHRKLTEKKYLSEGSTEFDRVMELLRENMAEDCLMCLEPMKTPSITMCGHWFCYECIKRFVEPANECPQCGTELPIEQVYTLPPADDEDHGDDKPSKPACKKQKKEPVEIQFEEDSEDEIKIIEKPTSYTMFAQKQPDRKKIDFFKSEPNKSNKATVKKETPAMALLYKDKNKRAGKLDLSSEFPTSTKISALMTFLTTCKASTPDTKSVVFSQWTSMLDLIEVPLSQAGLGYARLDGTMSRQLREANIDQFTHDPSIDVFLISTTCGAVGLNLVAASNCFMVDPMWNPMVERQAIDRIYRIGQTKPVTVVKLAMENSIEERVLELQEKKRKMAEDALGETNRYRETTSRSSRLDDIRALLGPASKDDMRLAEGLADFDANDL